MPQGDAGYDPHTELIAVEWERRGFEVEWLNRWMFRVAVAGRRLVFWGSRCVLNTHIASALTRRKDLTDRTLRDVGVSVPDGGVFRGHQVRRALRFAQSRWPVVVKPADSPGKGAGVSLGVDTPERFTSAFDDAADMSSNVLVQETVPGSEARVLVVNGRCVSVLRKVPNPKTGSTIGERQYEEITGSTHEFYKAEAEKAVAAFPGLGLAGLDVMAEDWTRPGRYAVIEVNSAPGIRGHHIAQKGVPFDAAGAIVDAVEAQVAGARAGGGVPGGR